MARRNPRDDYRKEVSVYRTEDRRQDDRGRNRSSLRTEERCDQLDGKKQKLAFGFGKKPGNEQKKGIQIKISSASVSKTKKMTLLLTDLLESIGYNEILNENDLTKSLRQEAARWACALNASACIHVATNKLTQHITDPKKHKLLPWWKYWTYCNGITATNDRDMTNIDSLCLWLLLYRFKAARNHKIFDKLLEYFEDIKPKEISMNAALDHFINHVYTYKQLYEIRGNIKGNIDEYAYQNIEKKIELRWHEIRRQIIYLSNF